MTLKKIDLEMIYIILFFTIIGLIHYSYLLVVGFIANINNYYFK